MTAWYDKATFYHMYPLGMTGSPFANPYPVSDGAADGTNRDVSADSRMDELMLWIPYLESLHISAIYIGPLFESSTHGYDTRDFRLIDRRLGTNVSFRSFVDLSLIHILNRFLKLDPQLLFSPAAELPPLKKRPQHPRRCLLYTS